MGTRRSPEGADLEMIVTIPHLLGAVYVEAATGLRVSWPTPQKCPTRLNLQPTKLTHNKGVLVCRVFTRNFFWLSYNY